MLTTYDETKSQKGDIVFSAFRNLPYSANGDMQINGKTKGWATGHDRNTKRKSSEPPHQPKVFLAFDNLNVTQKSSRGQNISEPYRDLQVLSSPNFSNTKKIPTRSL